MGFEKVNQKLPSEHLPPLKPTEEVTKSYPNNKITSMIQIIKGQSLQGVSHEHQYGFQALEIVSYPGDLLSFLSSYPRIRIARKNEMEQIINTRLKNLPEVKKQDRRAQGEEILRRIPEIIRDAAREQVIVNVEGNPIGEEEIEVFIKEFTNFLMASLEKHEVVDKKKETVEHKDEKTEKEIVKHHTHEKKSETAPIVGFPLSEEKIAMFKLLYLRLVENRRREENKQEEIRAKEILHRHTVSLEIKKDEIRKDEIRKDEIQETA